MAVDDKTLSSDIYGIHDYINELKKGYVSEANEDTLMLGIFGYFGEVMSNTMQNTIVMASEFSNESIATKAKFEKNVIAHALGLGICDINAVPAQMDVLLCFLEDDIVNWANAKTANGDELPWTFVFDKNNKIYFGDKDYEFHPDYNIVIKKVEVTTQGPEKRFAYTAQYDPEEFGLGNPVSNITNPYLTPPVKMTVNNNTFIMTRCTIRQVEKATQYTRVLSDNDVAAKTITFTFEGQLAAFTLIVEEGDEKYIMVPVYDGLNVDTGGQLYFWYTYLDSNTIRIKFDRNSRIPGVNAKIGINIQTTQGSKGNFTWVANPDNSDDGNPYPTFIFESTDPKCNYSNISCQVMPVGTGASYGSDKKTIEELKQIIPKEALRRDSITNTKDLNNYFNAINNDYSKLYFYKKRDNCLERLYYSFMIAKNDINIIPTNTVNLKLSPSDLMEEEGSGKLILKQGQIILLTPGDEEARLLKPGEKNPLEDEDNYDGTFAYYLPYDFIVNRTPLYGMYFLTTMHATKLLDFQFINDKCLYQYIATKFKWDRNCLEDHNTYTLSIDLLQNISNQDEDADCPIYTDKDTGAVVCNVDVYMVIYDGDGNPHRWSKAEMTKIALNGADDGNTTISYAFKFTTNDYIDNENRIRIDTGLKDIGTDTDSYAHLKANMSARLFVVSNQAGKDGASLGLGSPDLSTIIPEVAGKSLSNAYDVMGGLDFFYDYSGIVSSTITVTQDEIEGKTTGDDGDSTEDEPVKEVTFDNLGVVLGYMSNGEIRLFDTDRNRIGGAIDIPMNEMIVDFEENKEDKTLKLFFDKEKTRYITVKIDELTYEEPKPTPTETHYHITGIPVVKYDYFDSESTAEQFFSELVTRKAYIEDAKQVLEDAFEMDFKFFNTYGPAKFFTWDNALELLDRTNISLFFKLKLKPNFDSNIVEDIRKDIKDYVEDINQIQSFHIPNLITYITNKYKDSIVFFEFVSINGKDASYQHIYAMDVPDGIMVPEFVNINTLPDGTPDITIELV